MRPDLGKERRLTRITGTSHCFGLQTDAIEPCEAARALGEVDVARLVRSTRRTARGGCSRPSSGRIVEPVLESVCIGVL